MWDNYNFCQCCHISFLLVVVIKTSDVNVSIPYSTIVFPASWYFAKTFIFIIRWTFVCVIVMDNHQKHNIETRATAKWLVYHVPCSTPGSEESNSRCRFSVRGREIGCCIIIYTIGNVYVTKGSRHGILVNQCLLPSFIQFLFFAFDNFSFHGWFLLITLRTASVM